MLTQQPTVYGMAVDDAKRRVESGSSRSSVTTTTGGGGRSAKLGMGWSLARIGQRLMRLAARLSTGAA